MRNHCPGYTRVLTHVPQLGQQPLRELFTTPSLRPADHALNADGPPTPIVGADPQPIRSLQCDLPPMDAKQGDRLRYGVIERCGVVDLDARVLIDIHDADPLHAVRVAGASYARSVFAMARASRKTRRAKSSSGVSRRPNCARTRARASRMTTALSSAFECSSGVTQGSAANEPKFSGLNQEQISMP